MKKVRVSRGVLLATAAAALLITTQSFADDPTAAATKAKAVKCFGINSCRGRGQCGYKAHPSCAGLNTCKGKGWLYVMPDQCQKQGGTVIDAPSVPNTASVSK